MSFIANPQEDLETFNYVLDSIAVSRWYYLLEMSYQYSLKIALRDPSNDFWTKWEPFPRGLYTQEINNFGKINNSGLTAAIDVHRSILSNEIVVESDYPTYEENYEAARLIGRILEEKGFQPLYYFSGNKSIHCHVFFNWDCLKELDIILQDQLKIIFKDSKLRFKRKFMEWLRKKMITCWDTNAKQFDKDMINPTHLIRCELSKNKLGYKTFLGYTYKDMSFVPSICNEKNKIYPKLGEFRLSSPKDLSGLIEEFIEEMRVKTKIEKIKKRNRSLDEWSVKSSSGALRECVKTILNNDFKKIGDGFQRGMFILLNELRVNMGDEQARIIIHDWNSRMDFPIKDSEIEYRFKTKSYSLSCEYIHNFLAELGVDGKCNGKPYK